MEKVDQKRRERLNKLLRKQKRKNLAKRNKKLKDAADSNELDGRICIICMENERDSIFRPCGHGSCCFECAQKIVEENANCYYCRAVRWLLNLQEITKVLKIDNTTAYNNVYKVKEVFSVVVDSSDESEGEEEGEEEGDEEQDEDIEELPEEEEEDNEN